MSNIEPKPATRLAAVLAMESPEKSNPYAVARDAERLIALGKRAARIALQRCNGVQRYDSRMGYARFASWTDEDEARADKQAARIVSDANTILAAYNAGNASAHGDPRGHVLKFKLASERSNGFDAGVWGV